MWSMWCAKLPMKTMRMTTLLFAFTCMIWEMPTTPWDMVHGPNFSHRLVLRPLNCLPTFNSFLGDYPRLHLLSAPSSLDRARVGIAGEAIGSDRHAVDHDVASSYLADLDHSLKLNLCRAAS